MNIVKKMAQMFLAKNSSRGGPAGMMATEWHCALCKKEGASATSAPPLVCDECASELRSLLQPRIGDRVRADDGRMATLTGIDLWRGSELRYRVLFDDGFETGVQKVEVLS